MKRAAVAGAIIALAAVAYFALGGSRYAATLAAWKSLPTGVLKLGGATLAAIALLYLLVISVPAFLEWLNKSPASSAVLVTAVLLSGLYLTVDRFLALCTSYTGSDGKDIGPDVIVLLKILAGGGAFGGLISHFVRRRNVDSSRSSGAATIAQDGDYTTFNPVMLSQFTSVEGKPAIEGGILASVATGIGGAWGVLFILAKSMNLGGVKSAQDLLTIVGLGIVAGFSATALLRSLAKGLEKGLERADLERAEERFRTTAMQLNKNAKENAAAQSIASMVALADQAAAQAATLQPGPDAEAHRERARQLLNAADSMAGDFLQQLPQSGEVLVSGAIIKKRLALLNAAADPQREALLQQAIGLCSQALQSDPELERAYYNRACYRALTAEVRPEDLALIVADMKKAIELLPENKQLFASPNEHDIDPVRARPEVAALLTY